MGIKVRKATEADTSFIAGAILEYSRAGKKIGIFDLIFQCDSVDTLLEKLRALSVTQTKSYCHFSNFFIAEDNGNVVGALCGYEPRIATQEVFAKALAELNVDEAYQERIASYLLCMPELDRQTWVLDCIDIKLKSQELTILKELVLKSLLSARLKGYRKAEVIFDIGSVNIKMNLEKLGFHYKDEKKSDYYFEAFGRKGLMRMSMQL
jgi:hypothetical protein